MVHIHIASIDVHCRKSSNVKSFSKKSYENNKFQVYMYWKKILSSSAHAHEFCYFLVNFCRLGLNLNFYDNVYLQMHCGRASFQKQKKELLGTCFHGDVD